MDTKIEEPGIPAPGLYLVGEFRGINSITTRAGDTHNFARIEMPGGSPEVYIPAESLLEYAQRDKGDMVIVPVNATARKDKRTGEFTGEVSFSVRRDRK